MDSQAQAAAAKRLFKRRLLVIGAMRFVDSMNVTMIMPYGLDLVSKFLNQETEAPQAGLAYASLIGLYSLFEIIFSPLWGIVADCMGRRPCLLIGLAGTAVCPILLGLGQSLTVVFLFRALDGLFCGNQAILRTYLGELVDKGNEARSFSFLVLCFVLGLMAGPFLGGLAFPARWAPRVFAGTLFEDYPVLLPNLAFGVVTAVVCAIGFLCLEETLPKSKRRTRAQEAREAQEAHEAQEDQEDPEAPKEETSGADVESADLAKKGSKCYPWTVLQAMLMFCGLAGAVEAQNTLFILLWQYPESSGGFGFSPQQVAIVQVTGALGPIACYLTFFQKLMKLGSLNVLVLGFLLNSLSFGLYPVYGLFADSVKYGLWRYVALGLADFVAGIGTFLMFSAVFVFLNRSLEGQNRATVNGWANSGRALSRAVSPIVASQLLQACAEFGPLGRYIPFYIMTASLGACFAISWTGLQKLSHK